MTRRETFVLAAVLIAVSAAIYTLQLFVFHKPHDTFFYLLQDAAFVPLSVLMVTLLVDRLLAERERLARQHKMNMVISVFFASVGESLLRNLRRVVTNCDELAPAVAVTPQWRAADLVRGRGLLAQIRVRIRVDAESLVLFRDLLDGSTDTLLRLLENPVLLEHESFTDVLWSVFHIHDELSARADLTTLSEADLAHLAGDFERGYQCLLDQWLAYLLYLHSDYPYLYSLRARANPLRSDARAELT